MSTDTQSVELIDDAVVGNLARAALFAALTGAFAYVSFNTPASPAPVTLQMLGVFVAGLLLGPVWGGVAMVLYLAAGAVGLPVFEGGGAGFGQLVGVTAGYLWTYPLGAAAVGAIAHGQMKPRAPTELGLVRPIIGLVVGTSIIYLGGVLGLIIIGGYAVQAAIVGGALVFLPAEALKAAGAIGIVRSQSLAAT